MGNEQWQFKRYYFITTFALIFIITVGMGIYFVKEKYDEFQLYALNDKIANIENKKTILKNTVDSYIQQVSQVIDESEKDLDEKLKNRVRTAYRIAEAVNKKMSGKYSDEEIKIAIKSALASMTHGENYIFIIDTDGNIISSPLLKHIEGKNFIDKVDSEGNHTVRDAIEIAQTKGEGFQNVYWLKPGSEKSVQKRKRVFLRKFEPFNWIIGYGEYIDEFEETLKEEVLHSLDGIKYENDGYLFGGTLEGYILTDPAKGKNMYDVRDVNGKYIVRELIEKSKNGGGFVIYVMPPLEGERPENKISYVAPIMKWDWFIGAGMYLTDIESAYEERLAALHKSAQNEVILIVVGVIVLLVLAAVAVLVFSGRLQRLVDSYSEEINRKNDELENLNLSLELKVDEKTKELNDLNHSLELRVEEEVSKNREKDRIMFQQGRLAAMGEMIGNIAHQWRQPLSSISLLVQDIQEANELDELDDEYINSTVSKCTQTIEHMSETIDNFRDFFNPAKEMTDFSVNDEIVKCLGLIDASLENNNIKVNLSLGSDCRLHGVAGEYSQVLVNIINNAKDVLLMRSVDNPVINIESGVIDGESFVKIGDNAGGVSEDIIDKIFEPYFTTKQVSQGTGIGLYFSKMIIEGNMRGSLKVDNCGNGACFTIKVSAV